MIVCLVAMMGVLPLSAQAIYEFKVKNDAGKEVSLSAYRGKVLLIVNTATRCGFTPQYKELEALYTYLKSQKGFGGFDLNDKTGKLLDGMMRKKDPEYDKSSDIKWNFTKFLVSADGQVLKRYEPTDKISQIEEDVKLALKH